MEAFFCERETPRFIGGTRDPDLGPDYFGMLYQLSYSRIKIVRKFKAL